MKRIIAVFGAAALLFCLLTSCTGEEPKPLVLEDVYQDILAAQGEMQSELVLFPESDPAFFDSFYPGLNDVELTQQVYYIAPVAGAACEVLLVEVADQSDTQAVKDICQARIDAAAADTVYPDVAVIWARNAKVQSSGRYVAMIALPNGFTIPENVFE